MPKTEKKTVKKEYVNYGHNVSNEILHEMNCCIAWIGLRTPHFLYSILR